MSRDACQMLKGFDELVETGVLNRSDLNDLIQECIGEKAESGRAWVPLCPEYPNLKGVTCEEIDTFIDKQAPDISHNEEWRKKILDLSSKYNAAYKEMREKVKEYERGGHPDWKDPELEFWYSRDGDGVRIKGELRKFLKETLPEKERKMLEEDPTLSGISDVIDWALNLNQKRDPGTGWRTIPGRDYTKEYLHNVKVFDRDEEYRMFKELGNTLAHRIWDLMSDEERANVLSKSEAEEWESGTAPEEFMAHRRKKILSNCGNIYITTPKGGHECLSIFAYANGLDKTNMPSDIVPPWDKWEREDRQKILDEFMFAIGEGGGDKSKYTYLLQRSYSHLPKELQIYLGNKTIGRTWMGRDSCPVKRVIMVDDIVASGEQVKLIDQETLRVLGRDVALWGVHLCHRRPEDVYHRSPIEDLNREVWGQTTTGIEIFDQIYEETPPSEIEREMAGQVITCAFPHSIPDGRSDDLLSGLYGGRTHTEKRILRPEAK